MENTTHIAAGHWVIKNGKGLASSLLFVLGIWLSACSSLHPTVTGTSVPVPAGSILPTWSQIELPPGCSFHSLSPNLCWMIMMGCRYDIGDTNWIVQVDENGRLYNFRPLKGRLLPYDEGSGIIGFTRNSSRLIVKYDKVFGFINLVDLTSERYVLNVPGTSGLEHFGTERWSSNGRLLSPDCWGCGQIFVIYPDAGTEEMVLDGLGRHGAQYTWSADGQEIAYVEGDYHEGMSARILNWQTHQSRTLVESQSPASLTGASYSPDGKWIAVREQNTASSENATLWLIDATVGTKIQLSYSLSGVEVHYGWQDMVWSPDSSRLALRGSSGASIGFVVVEIPSGKIIQRGTNETGGAPLAWSTDGKSLLVLDFHEEADSTIGNDILRWVQIK